MHINKKDIQFNKSTSLIFVQGKTCNKMLLLFYLPKYKPVLFSMCLS